MLIPYFAPAALDTQAHRRLRLDFGHSLAQTVVMLTLKRVFLLVFLAVAFRVGAASETSPSTAVYSPAAARIALMSDVHVAYGTNVDYPRHFANYKRVVGDICQNGVDLVLVAGDLTEHGTARELDDFKAELKRLDVPVWYVPGNHDVGNKRIKGKKEAITRFRLARYELRMGPSFFVREHHGVRVVGINSGLAGSGFGREQQMWSALEKALARTSTVPTLAILHHPPFLKKVSEPGGDYFNLEPYPRRRLLALLEQGGVRTVLSGHIHRGLTNRVDGVVLYSTPPVAFGLPKGKQQSGWTLVTVPQQGKPVFEFRPLKED